MKMPDKCAAGQTFQEIADFCRCKFTEPLIDEIYKLQVENKRLRKENEMFRSGRTLSAEDELRLMTQLGYNE